MTVRELIKQLLEEDMDSEVVVEIGAKHIPGARYDVDGIAPESLTTINGGITILVLD